MICMLPSVLGVELEKEFVARLSQDPNANFSKSQNQPNNRHLDIIIAPNYSKYKKNTKKNIFILKNSSKIERF